MSPEHALNRKPLIFVASEKGGVRKTFTSMAVIDVLLANGLGLKVFQIDQQGRLQSAFADVSTISLPPVDIFRADELADGRALAPLDEAISGVEDAIIVDVGANLDARLATFAVAGEWFEEAITAGRDVFVLTPFLLDMDSVTLAARTAQRLLIAFEKATIIPVACVNEPAFQGFPSAEVEGAFVAGFAQDARERLIIHPPLYSSALRLIEGAGVTPQAFVELDAREAAAALGIPRAALRQAQGDVARYVQALRTELHEVFPFRHDG
jgi:hypothetical protein